MAFKLFNKKRKDVEIRITAPMNGEVVALEDVPDPVFSQKMMGDGIAVTPTDGKVCAPADAKVMHVFPSKHAIGLLLADGTEVLIHIGLETVGLKGEGFTLHVDKDQDVKQGELLIEFDLDYVKEHAVSLVTPIIITNGEESGKTLVKTSEVNAVQGETVLITISE